ncbi:MAG: translesion DNA synthesis-associated protein ImuA [Betaproteobacteria bacterium]
MESSTTSAALPLKPALLKPAPNHIHPRVFRIGDLGAGKSGGTHTDVEEISTGFAALDSELTGGGWSRPGITEILCNHTGIGELSLIMKALSCKHHALQPGEATHMLWVLPPHFSWIPYAPALAQCGINLDHLAIVRAKNTDDALWAAEQGLKSGACRAVLLRLNEAWCNPLSLRRLNQAAMAGNCLLWLMRPLSAADSPSPAGTRIVLQPEKSGALRLEMKKRRGLPPGKTIHLETRTLDCLRREPMPVVPRISTPQSAHDVASITASLSPGWLEGVLSTHSAPDMAVRHRQPDSNRR